MAEFKCDDNWDVDFAAEKLNEDFSFKKNNSGKKVNKVNEGKHYNNMDSTSDEKESLSRKEKRKRKKQRKKIKRKCEEELKENVDALNKEDSKASKVEKHALEKASLFNLKKANKSERKRKLSEDNVENSQAKKQCTIQISNDNSVEQPQPKKKRRNRKKKNNSKKNKYKHLALNNQKSEEKHDDLELFTNKEHTKPFSNIPDSSIKSQNTYSEGKVKIKINLNNSKTSNDSPALTKKTSHKYSKKLDKLSEKVVIDESVNCESKVKSGNKYSKKNLKHVTNSFDQFEDIITNTPKKTKKNSETKINSSTPSEILSKKKSKKEETSKVEDSFLNAQMFNTAKVNNPFSISPEGKAFQLRQKAENTLNSARFRFINEQLYSITGSDAKDLFKNDKHAFEVYHQGFQHQVEKWPVNPLDIIIKQIKKRLRKDDLVVVDFGCGDARLSQSVPHKVFSLDLVALNENVTVCEMSKTPLDSECSDIAVFCLSLMGTNLSDYLKEANRILKIGGLLKIAEVVSRFDSIKDFTEGVSSHGFQLLNKKKASEMFYLLDFKKIKPVKKLKHKKISLNPCVYKRR